MRVLSVYIINEPLGLDMQPSEINRKHHIEFRTKPSEQGWSIVNKFLSYSKGEKFY